MTTEFRKNRKKWGYRFSLHGKSWKRYAWDTREEAKDAEAAHRTELLNNPALRSDSLGNVAALYLIDSAERGRSKWRIEALRYNLNAFILPFFKPETPITEITEVDVEKFVKNQKRRGVKNDRLALRQGFACTVLLGDEKPRAQETLRQAQSSFRRRP